MADGEDRSLEQYLMDTKDVQGMCKKVQKSTQPKETLRRRGMTRIQILEEAAQGGGPAPNTGPSSSSTEVSGGSSSSAGGVVRATITEQLAQLEDLRSRGVLDDEEFKLGKRAILNPS